MISIGAGFIGNFKIGDNINYNLQILNFLYMATTSHENDHLTYKLIIILNISIIEALLYDFHDKARTRTRVGVKNVASEIIAYIRGKEIDRFEQYIQSAKKHNILDVKSESVYDEIDNLRKLRNRIHIQNEKNDFERDDCQAFSKERKIKSEKLLEIVMKKMSLRHGNGENEFVRNFELPWDEFYCPKKKNISSI